MIKVKEDLTGKKFGRLTVIEQIEDYITPSGNRYNRWLCECSCSQHKRIPVCGNSLKTRNTKSCGCLDREKTIERSKKYNEYRIDGDIVIGKASNTDDEFMVDLQDFDKIKDICWHVTKTRTTKELRGWDPIAKQVVKMHKFLGFNNYDHIDRNELNNCRNNLRTATPQEQVWNRNKASNKSSNVVGVSWYERDKRWVSEFFYNGKKIFRKYFQTEEEAIRARLNEEIKYIKPEFSPNRHLYQKYDINIQEQEVE